MAGEAAELARQFAEDLKQREDQLLAHKRRDRRSVTVASGNTYVLGYRIQPGPNDTPVALVTVGPEGAGRLFTGATERFEFERSPAALRWQASARRRWRWLLAAVGLGASLVVLLGIEVFANFYARLQSCGWDGAVDPAAGSARADYCGLFGSGGRYETVSELGLFVLPPVLLALFGMWLIRRERYRLLAVAVCVAWVSPIIWWAAVAALPSG